MRGLDQTNSTGTLVDFKFQFLKIIVNYEYYVQLNSPQKENIETAVELKEVFWYLIERNSFRF